MKVEFLGHSACIINMNHKTILTDPWLTESCYGVIKRTRKAGKSPEALPPLHLIVASHLHADHLHKPTMRRIASKDALVVGPKGLSRYLGNSGFQKVKEFRSWEEYDFQGIRLVAVPAKHLGPSLGFVLQGEKTIYFAGDTRFFDGMRDISSRFSLDVALIPIGGAAALGLRVVMSPRDALAAARLLNPKVIIPIHWGTFPNIPFLFGMEGTPREFKSLVEKGGLEVEVEVLEEGQTWEA